MDFSDFETSAAETWQVGSVVDYVTKFCLSCAATPTQSARDAVALVEAALVEAESLLGQSLLEDCRHPQTGEVYPLVIVSDNGPAFKSARFMNFVLRHQALNHVRTRYRAPHTNGVVERWNGTLKYENLYREEISTGWELQVHCTAARNLYNDIRPHEHLDFATPLSAYLATPSSPPRLVAGRFVGGMLMTPDTLPRSTLVGHIES